MKHITLLAVAALMSASVQSQVFTSGLEDWSENLPTDWVGSKTNIATTDIVQVSENPHGGASAVRVANATSGHKRFTTQNVEVTSGTVYNFTFWVRGAGEIRTGLWDGLSDAGSSYAYNSTYITATAEWTEVTQQVTCPSGASSVQFVLSIRNTVAPEHLVVDDVVIEEAEVLPPVEATIYEIQFTEAVDGASPLANQAVITSGIVTGAKAGYGYFIQDGTGPWNGIFVNDATNAPALGDLVAVTATVQENFAFTRLNTVTVFEVTSSGNDVPAAEVLTPSAASSEQWESVLVTVADVECLTAPNQFGEWNIANWQGTMLADDELFAATPTVGAFYTITGPMYYAFSTWRVLPRSLDDLGVGTGIAEASATTLAVYPNPANVIMNITINGVIGRADYIMNDATGRQVMAGLVNSERTSIDVNGLTNGMYVLTIRNNGVSTSTRIAVQH